MTKPRQNSSIWSCVRRRRNGKCRRVNGARRKPSSPSCSKTGSSWHDGQPAPHTRFLIVPLLVDAPDPLHGADIEGVLGAAVARTLALELAMRLLLTLGLLKRGELALGQHQALLGDLRLERLEPLLHGLKLMALPHAAHAGGRDRVAALADLVGDPDLAEGGLLKRQSKD